MEMLTEPIDLPDVRAELSLSRDDQREDDFLTSAISFCRDRLEGILPYYLAERDVTKEADLICRQSSVVGIPLKGPVLEVRDVHLRLTDHSWVDVPPDAYSMSAGGLRLDLAEAFRDGEGSVRIPTVLSAVVTYRAGAHIPPVVKSALLRMVRIYYEDRTSDPLTDEIVRMVSTERRWSVR